MSSPYLDSAKPNLALRKFMSRNAPQTEPTMYRGVIDETVTRINYPKDITGTVLLKNASMRMAYTRPDEKKVTYPQPDVLLGRLKSDVTTGFERIYERSYY